VILIAGVLVAVSLGLSLYAYVGYPVLLKLLNVFCRSSTPRDEPKEWPLISITIPVHNEAAVIAGTLERILELDYPAGRRQVLVVSDASTDGTDDIVRRFAGRGVELLRLPERCGKTAAENAAGPYLTGDVIVNTDASVRMHPLAVKHLVAAFADPSVGVASGSDVSVASLDDYLNPGEQTYVGYEMWVRGLETRVYGIVGASGCLYAIRKDLHLRSVPAALSRDFAAALAARECGVRAVSVPKALCFVPRSPSLRQEYRRKVRTVTRGLTTLFYQRALLNPARYGLFAWMLFSHKVCRWLTPWAALLLLGSLAALAPGTLWARAALGAVAAVGGLAGLGWLWPETKTMPRLIALPAYLVAGHVAVLHAWLRALSGELAPVWEPTRRQAPAAR
jgi:cellulose synthase/poly-beta-1,6-N-acetylglucosamine synthase-like glycosyltransferase